MERDMCREMAWTRREEGTSSARKVQRVWSVRGCGMLRRSLQLRHGTLSDTNAQSTSRAIASPPSSSRSAASSE